VPASLLGFRINEKFVKQFFGRVLANPSTVENPASTHPHPSSKHTPAFIDTLEHLS